jgi:hypothetical protein
MMGVLGVEQVSVYLDAHGNVFPIASPLPEYHPASPDFHIEHDAALTLAITERADALGVPPADVRRLVTVEEQAEVRHDGATCTRSRYEIRDTEPKLLPGTLTCGVTSLKFVILW